MQSNLPYCLLFYYLSITIAYGQVSTGYTSSQLNSTYSSVSGGTVLGTTSSDDQLFITNTTGANPTQTAAGFPIGFTFYYNGASYTRFGVSMNGYIMLGNLPTFVMPAYGSGNFGLPASGTINVNNGIALFANSNIISALNYDLIGQAGSTLQCITTGTAPSRVLTVQWSGVTSFGKTGNFNFQIKLYEANTIEFCYGSFTHDATLEDARVGLYGSSNADFLMKTGSTSWTAVTNGTTSGASVAFNNTVFQQMD